jgi:hypothetical protein
MNACQVCVEPFNHNVHKNISCPFCDFECCRTCCQKYLLSTSSGAHCMNCKHEFNRSFIDSFCTKRFRNIDYKKHRENILFEKESARLPDTQPYVTRILESRMLHVSFVYLVELLRHVTVSDTFSDRVKEVLIELLRTTIIHVSENAEYIRTTEVQHPTPIFTMKCPVSECRGFLFDDWICGICKRKFCESCHEELNDSHVCDQNLVKTVKLLKRDTKPCPKCNVPIHKIDGCSQMWCTQCHVAFDWRSGLIETGRIHNPHYVQFYKRTREHSDIPCGGCPTYHELKRNKATPDILDVHLEVTRLQRELVNRYGYMYEDHHHLRIKYLLGGLTDVQFKRELQKREKTNDKVRDIQDIYRMFIDTVSDALRKLMIYPETVDDTRTEIRDIITYTNSVMHDIRKRYTSRMPYNILSYNDK